MPVRFLTDAEGTAAQGGGTLSQIGKGAFVGASKEPFIGAIVRSLGEIAGVDQRGLAEMEKQLQGRTAFEVSEFIGEYGPGFLFGVGAYSAGKLAGTAAVRSLARQVVAKGAQSTAAQVSNAAVRSAVLHENPLAMARLLPGAEKFAEGAADAARAGGSKFQKQMGLIADKANDVAGGMARIQGTPALQRVAEIAGGNTGIASVVFGQEKSRGKTDTQALKSAGIALALGVGFEGALTAGGKALFGRAKTFRTDDIEAGLYRPGPGQVDSAAERIQNEILAGVNRLDRLNHQLSKVTGLEATITNLESAQKVLKESPKAAIAARNIEQKINRTRSEIGVLDEVLANPGKSPYTTDQPWNPTIINRALDRVDPAGKLRHAWFTAPEAGGGDYGPAGNRIHSVLLDRAHEADAMIRVHEGTLSHLSERARKALGLKEKDWVTDHTDLWEAWEMGRDEGVRAYASRLGRSTKDADEVIGVMKEVELGTHEVLIKRGVPAGLRAEMNLEEMGVKAWLPRMSESGLTDDEMMKRLIGSGIDESDAVDFLKRAKSHVDEHVPLGGIGGKGTGTTGSLDFDRVYKGSIKEGMAKGIPYNRNLFDTALRVRSVAERRIAYDPVVGRNGELLEDLAATVGAEGGNAAKFETMVNSVVQKHYYPEAWRRTANAITGAETASKLALSVIPNMSQIINTITYQGIRPAAKGLLAVLKREDINEVSRMAGIHHHFIKGISRSADDQGLIAGPMEKLADYMLRYTGFDYIERLNRLHAGMTSIAVIKDTLAKSSKGKLRGTLLDSRRNMFGDMGLDLDGLTRRINMHGDNFLQSEEFKKTMTLAAIRGAQKTQFFSGSTRTPTGWRHPLGRVLTQFKTFAVGQSRFIRDGILIDAANGNLRPMATMLALAPITGELVGDAKAFIKNKDRNTNGVMRALENISYVGGLGLFSDLVSSARYGRLEGALLGPGISDMTTLGEALLTLDARKASSLVSRTPAFQLGSFLLSTGANTIEEIDKYLDSTPGGGSETPATIIDVGALRQRNIDKKRPQQ